MGDLQIGEAFKDKVFIIETATGNPWLLQAPTCVIIDESGNRAAGAPAEESDGWYTCSFTPDAAGTWSTEWGLAGATIYSAYKEFKVGGGEVTDIKAETALILADTNAILTDTSTTLDDLVDDLETRVTAARAGYLDELAAANIPADVDTLKSAVVVIDEYHDVPAQNAAANAQMNEVIGNKTDTTAGDSLVSLVKVVDGNVDDIETRVAHHLVTRTWFSPSQEEVAVTNGAGDKTLPSVTLPNITGTIVHVYAGFKFRMIENTNAAVNKLSGAQELQVRVDTPGAWADAVNFVDDQFGLAASTREGGDCVIGTIDLVGTVTAFNDIYEFQWDEAVADQSNLQFNDVQTFLIVSYY